MDIGRLVRELEESLDLGEAEGIDLTSFMQTCLKLIEEISRDVNNSSEQDKQRALQDLTFLQSRLEGDLHRLSKRTGKTVEELGEHLEIARNFPEDVWALMQKCIRQLSDLKTRRKKHIIPRKSLERSFKDSHRVTPPSEN